MEEKSDAVLESVIKMIQYARQNHTEQMEIEARVGKFTHEHEFVAGYPKEQIPLITKMLERMQKNATVMDDPRAPRNKWEMIPKYYMVRGSYDHGLRRTCRPNQTEPEFVLKKQVGKLDLLTDRSYHLRISLCKESTVEMNKSHPMYETVTKKPPLSVRYVQRASFVERVPAFENFPEIVFQWDISKTSPEAPTKAKASESPCMYHCECELQTKLFPVENKLLERQQDEYIAQMLICRASALLGTSYKSAQGQLVPLPPAKLVVINSKEL